jgi:holliday junction DNA helicase RuvA
MIALLTGILRQLDSQNLILDVNGVGYQVAVTTRTQAQLGTTGTPATLHIVTQVREDAITLYGFATRDEKDTFVKLTTVQGVGAKMALSLLSAFSGEQLWRAIISDDKKMLTAAEGVGPKLAARLTTELKDWASKQIFPGTAPTKAKAVMSATPAAAPSVAQEAISALINLGYTPSDATRAVSITANENDGADLATLIRLSLREAAHA